jgi:hypothetical protein
LASLDVSEQRPVCMQTPRLTRVQIAAFLYYEKLSMSISKN